MGITHRKRNTWLAEVRPLAARAEHLPLDLPEVDAAEEHATDKYLVGKRIIPGSAAHASAYRKLIAYVRPREPAVAAFSEAVEAPRLKSATLASLRANLHKSGQALVGGKYADAALWLSRAEADYAALGEHERFRRGQLDTHEERVVASDLSEGKFAEGATRLATLVYDVYGRRGHDSRHQLSALCPALERLLMRMFRADQSFLSKAPALTAALTPLLQLDDAFVFPTSMQHALLEQVAPSENVAPAT